MQTVLIVIHLMIVFSLVIVVLLQRSEGGALGIGGGGGFLTSRGQANVLTRATAFLAAGFFATSLALTILAGWGKGGPSVFDRPASSTSQPAAPSGPTAPLGTGQGGILNQLRPGGAPPPAAPAGPAAPPLAAPSGQATPPTPQ
jgi:preprotein translocase subunit SecG